MENIGVILKELREVIQTDYEGTDNENWDGSVSFSGVKRMIYGLWNDGCNEQDEDIVEHMAPKAKEKYKEMVEKYKETDKVSVFL